MLEITRTSPFTGITRTKLLDVNQYQLDNWKHGMLIQDAMPTLSAADREFIKTGIAADEWPEPEPEE